MTKNYDRRGTKTSIYIDDETKRRIQELARLENRNSFSETLIHLVRVALDHYDGTHVKPEQH